MPPRRSPPVDEDTSDLYEDVRRLERRFERLEELRRDVSELKADFGGIATGIENHIKQAMPAAVRFAVESEMRPIADRFNKLDRVLEILHEQETRAKVKAEEKAAEEVARAEKTAAREHTLKRLAIWGPIVIALIGAISATVASQVRGPNPPSQSAPK